MRKKEIIHKIDELTQTLTKPDLKKIEAVIAEVLVFFDYTREKLQSSDPKDREAALKDIQEIQKKLEDLSRKALEASGMSPEQLSAFITNPNNFTPADWEKLQKIEGDVNSFGKKHNNPH